MSTYAATQSQARPSARARSSKRGGNQGRGGNREQGQNLTSHSKASSTELVLSAKKSDTIAVVAAVPDAAADKEADVCFICAEPVKYYSVSECNHRTCHVCTLRLRALYKKTDCTFCKEPQPAVVFTASPDALFSSFAPDAIPHKDMKLSIFFETQEMMEDTLILLRFNCPDPECDYIGNGWGDLKLHVRATHGKLMCDLCVRFKKVFAHEHALYPPNVLPIHLPSMHQRQHNKPLPTEQVEGGIHPLCEFCRECFFSDDDLFMHMRDRHEECFICKRNNVKDQYFLNYETLERHFNHAHHPCKQAQCLSQKFVVFNTALDLQAHTVEVHGGEMSNRDKKDARRVQAAFEFEEVGVGGRYGRRERGDRDREHEPPPQPRPQQQQQSSALTAPVPTQPPGPGRRREGFGASLTVDGASPSPNNNTPEHSRPPSPRQGDIHSTVMERHSSFIARLQSLAVNPVTAVPVVKAAIRGYRASEASARDLISTIWNVLDRNVEHTASIVNAFVDLLEEEEKKQDVLSSWKGFAIEQRRQFPDLVPTAVGSGYAAITSGRVLNAKHATAAHSPQQSSRQVWDRVARAAGSSGSSVPTPSKRFPALQASTPVTQPFRQGQRITPWSASATSASSGLSTSSQEVSESQGPPPRTGPGGYPSRSKPLKLSSAQFPELPTSAVTRLKAPASGNVSLKNILGNPGPPAVAAWQTGGNASTPSQAQQTVSGDGEADVVTTSTTKGKKGKGKQTLFTLGSFPG